MKAYGKRVDIEFMSICCDGEFKFDRCSLNIRSEFMCGELNKDIGLDKLLEVN